MENLHKFSFYIGVFCFLIIFPKCAEFSSRTASTRAPGENIKYNVVHSWADKLGMELFHLGDFITRRKEVQESFKQAQVVSRSGAKIVENMANEVKMMMDLKISAVRRIMDTAENTALSHQNEKPDEDFSYYSAKEMLEPGEPIPTMPPKDLEDSDKLRKIPPPPKEIVLTPKSQFFNEAVNLSLSSVHIPTNVYDRGLGQSKRTKFTKCWVDGLRRYSQLPSAGIASEVIQAIKWSENLDQIFLDNYKKDPTLSWQFFGSSTGFMRQFPASKWKQDPVDLYDCRLRSWYMEAATSPKDVIILMDGSGSMTGQRLDIAKHVVKTILDTLGTNDFVNIFTFGEDILPAVRCFQDQLVQATLGNVRELKQAIEVIETEGIANYSAALTKAFEVLADYRSGNMGANCNQAIMIISDGAPYPYTHIFDLYNWQNLPFMPVRVFTYLIGKEVADVLDIKNMACGNQGYYVHFSDLPEVREMVLNYIPVMARPLVLGRHDHPVVWTQVYADEIDPKMSDWLWEIKQSEEQKMDVENYRMHGYRMFFKEEEDRRNLTRMKKSWDQPTESDRYQFMTTVSMPVYDRRENATLIANLLGVAGTDVPIRDIKKLLSPYMLGVNGYAFIVTNNGFILFHPDFRPTFQDILKPAYNSVDMIEVELLDDDKPPRVFNQVLIGIRDAIINQSNGSKWMLVKNHFDSMRRVARIKREYYWTAIQNTPFTLVITYPEQYGTNRLQIRSEDEIHRMNIKGSNIGSYFSGGKWKIHPDWLYCKHSNMSFASPESELMFFLGKMAKPGWKWPLSRSSLPPEHTAAMYCDRNLIQSLVFDARVTEWFSKNTSFNTKDDKGNEFKQRFGITIAFLATHSGLTRWQEFHSNSGMHSGQQFSENNRRATDEVWYQRAVDQHFVREESFVYSVPFDSGENGSEPLVTASHAVFHSEGSGKKAPAAVVGFQFQHSALYTLFRNITSSCVDCPTTCASEDIDCFILDNNGYILISTPRMRDTGKFFGEVNGALMRRLVEEKVYKEVVIYDYQAVCFERLSKENASSQILSPLMHILSLAKWLLRTLTWYIVQLHMLSVEAMDQYFDDNMTDYAPNNKDWLSKVTLRRTRLKSCDHQRRLFTFYSDKENIVYNITAHSCERPFVVLPIPASNLILLVVDTLCPREPAFKIKTDPEEILYGISNNESLACFKRQTELSRVRPVSCINKHANESKIELCGNANAIWISPILLLTGIFLVNYL